MSELEPQKERELLKKLLGFYESLRDGKRPAVHPYSILDAVGISTSREALQLQKAAEALKYRVSDAYSAEEVFVPKVILLSGVGNPDILTKGYDLLHAFGLVPDGSILLYNGAHTEGGDNEFLDNLVLDIPDRLHTVILNGDVKLNSEIAQILQQDSPDLFQKYFSKIREKIENHTAPQLLLQAKRNLHCLQVAPLDDILTGILQEKLERNRISYAALAPERK